MLGKRFGDPKLEDSMDRRVKRFLVKTWNRRAGLTEAINSVLGTAYDIVTARAG